MRHFALVMLPAVHIAAFCVELPLLLLHASVFAFIACEIWNGKKALKSTFYCVYAVLTCADCFGYLLVSLRIFWFREPVRKAKMADLIPLQKAVI